MAKYKITKYKGKTKIKDTKSGKSMDIDIEKFMNGGYKTIPEYNLGTKISVEDECNGDPECLEKKRLEKLFNPLSQYTTPQSNYQPYTSPGVSVPGQTNNSFGSVNPGVEGDGIDYTLDPASNSPLQQEVASNVQTQFPRQRVTSLNVESNSVQDVADLQEQLRSQKLTEEDTTLYSDKYSPEIKKTENNYQMFNPYAGADIPSAAFTLGSSIKSGNKLGIAGSSLKLATGLGRNFVSGLGQANRYNQVMRDAREKERDNRNTTQYYEEGGEVDPTLPVPPQKPLPKDFNSVFDYDIALKQHKEDMEKWWIYQQNPNQNPEEPDEFYKDRKKNLDKLRKNNLNPQSRWWESVKSKQNELSFFPRLGSEIVTSPIDVAYAIKENLLDTHDTRKYKSTKDKINEFIENFDSATDLVTLGSPLGTGLKNTLKKALKNKVKKEVIQETAFDVAKSVNNKFEYGGKKEEELATGEYVRGVENENKENFNSEVERGEYIQTNQGDIAEIVGNKHSQGGEKLQMEAGDRVLSDKLKLGAKTAKKLAEKYDIKVKYKNTYADVLDKLRKKLKLDKIVEEEATLMKKIADQEKVEDSTTRDLNLQVLAEKQQELAEQKHPLEEQRKDAFEELFKLQESSKKGKKKDNESFEDGGMKILEDLSSEYGIPLERARELVQAYEKGGKYIPKYEEGVEFVGPGDKMKKVSKEEAKAKVESGEWEEVSSGRYIERGSSKNIDERTSTGIGYEEAYKNVDKNDYPTLNDFIVASEKWHESQRLNNFSPDKHFAAFSALEGNTKPHEFNIDSELTTELGRTTLEPKAIYEGEEEPINTNYNKKNTERIRGEGIGLPLFPDESPLAPTGLQGTLKPEARFDRVRPTEIDARPYLQDIRDRESSQIQNLEGLSPNVRAAVLSNLRANSQKSESDIRMNIDTQNLQSQEKAIYTNAQIQRMEQNQNNNYRQGYEDRIYTAQAKTDDDIREYLNTYQALNAQRYDDIHNLNLINATNEDVAYVPGKGYVRKEGSSNREITEQLSKMYQSDDFKDFLEYKKNQK